MLLLLCYVIIMLLCYVMYAYNVYDWVYYLLDGKMERWNRDKLLSVSDNRYCDIYYYYNLCIYIYIYIYVSANYIN